MSQLRVRIEQTFGLMRGKWRILCQPLQMSLKMSGIYLYALQGYITSASMRATFLSTILGSEREFMHSNVYELGIVGSSVLHNIIVQDLVKHGLERPDFD